MTREGGIGVKAQAHFEWNGERVFRIAVRTGASDLVKTLFSNTMPEAQVMVTCVVPANR